MYIEKGEGGGGGDREGFFCGGEGGRALGLGLDGVAVADQPLK